MASVTNILDEIVSIVLDKKGRKKFINKALAERESPNASGDREILKKVKKMIK